MLDQVKKFSPHLVIMASWNFPHYMRIATYIRREGGYVLSGMDNQWRGTGKQWLGVLGSRVFLKPAIDNFLVAGDRQADFARRLGYDEVLHGLYAADVPSFAGGGSIDSRNREFLFAGRLSEVKGIRILLTAYEQYRTNTIQPWGLAIAGDGPLRNLVSDTPNVRYVGFVQLDHLPALMQSVRCLVLPSTFEPWGVVIHEAAAAGLPVICTYRCGAGSAFVRDGLNGLIIPPKVPQLTRALASLSNRSEAELNDMSQYSRQLSQLWTPSLLAAYLAHWMRENKLSNSVLRSRQQ
jgi:glycosyltransferase involved in cell wall biosynthesis